MKIGDRVRVTDKRSSFVDNEGTIEERRQFIGLPLGVRLDGFDRQTLLWCHPNELEVIN